MPRAAAQVRAPKPKKMPRFSPAPSSPARATPSDGKRRRHRALRDKHPLRVYVKRILRKNAPEQGMAISRNAVSVMTCLLEKEAADIVARGSRAAAFDRVSTLKCQHLQNPIGLIYHRTPQLANLMLLHAASAVQAFIASREGATAPAPAAAVATKAPSAPLAPVAEEGYDDSDDDDDSKSVAA